MRALNNWLIIKPVEEVKEQKTTSGIILHPAVSPKIGKAVVVSGQEEDGNEVLYQVQHAHDAEPHIEGCKIVHKDFVLARM